MKMLNFLGKSSSYRPVKPIFVVLILATIILSFFTYRRGTKYEAGLLVTTMGKVTQEELPSNLDPKLKQRVHIIVPATHSDVNLCKNLLTQTILGYPAPHIVGWKANDQSQEGLIGGGTHFLKINRAVKYINDPDRRKKPGFEDDLLVLLDGYDIWFQLPLDVLISRYHDLVRDDNRRVAHRMGRAYANEDVYTDIIFGAGKRCAPNELHTLSCFAVPESPLPSDLHGTETDTTFGMDIFSSFRARYLNAGFAIGPIKKLRPVLERAAEKLQECFNRTNAPFDNGSHESDQCYLGSDQSIWAEIYGEQEFHREIMRRHHRSSWDTFLDWFMVNRPGSKPPATQVFMNPVDDMLNPSFKHQEIDTTYQSGKPFEYGIGLDYWAHLIHQTIHASWDARFLRHNQSVEPQLGELKTIDCSQPVSDMPKDLPAGPLSFLANTQPNTWETLPLYSEVCLNTVPVMIHHNDVHKALRIKLWNETWWNGRARFLLDEAKRRGAPQMSDFFEFDNGDRLTWAELCPEEYEQELFRDAPEKKP